MEDEFMDVAAKLPGRSVYNKKAKPSAVQSCFAPGTWSLFSRAQLVKVHFFSAPDSTAQCRVAMTCRAKDNVFREFDAGFC